MKQSSFNLIKEIHGQSVLEADGVLSKIAKGIKGAMAGAKAAVADGEQPAKDDTPDIDTPDTKSEGISALSTMVSKLLTPASGTVRMVLFLPLAHLADQYLKTGGGAGAVAAMKDDSEIEALVTDPVAGKSRLVQMPNNFTFASLITPPKDSPTRSNSDVAVIMNVPMKLVADLKGAGDNLDEAREVLKRMMSHKYYVMTLSLARAKKIAPAMREAKDLEQRKKVFNPYVLENYPVKQDFVRAKVEWDEAQSGEHQDDEPVVQQVAQDQEQKPKIVKPEMNSVIISTMMKAAENGSFDPGAIANGLRIKLSSDKSQKEVEAALRSMGKALGSAKFDEVADKVSDIPSWQD